MRSKVKGFTLVEIMVALVIGVMVLTGARFVLHQIADTADLTATAAREADRQANTERMLRALINRTEVADSINVFHGDATSVRFTTSCDVPQGWRELCTAVLWIGSRDSVQSPATPSPPNISVPVSIHLATSRGDSLHIVDGVPFAALRYLEDPANGGVWRSSWPAGMTTPLAIGIMMPGDTLILRLGERR